MLNTGYPPSHVLSVTGFTNFDGPKAAISVSSNSSTLQAPADSESEEDYLFKMEPCEPSSDITPESVRLEPSL